ncbi:hypothetical protein [Bradyrhizobium lablabi]|uniref:hypothetical protein n=1 Tax=Bradyrhizobium lablabi TaxID=722472 RepID=UPI0012AB6E3D|nr:hypothetical protein [Bradyrhizobium lablabi]
MGNHAVLDPNLRGGKDFDVGEAAIDALWIPLKMILSAAPALMLVPLVPATKTDPSVALQLSVIDLVMVTAPKPPGSRQLISLAAAVLEIAPANVLQGAVRLHGWASSPTPETHVRVA